MSTRSLHSTTKKFLLENEEFIYADLVKFEKPSPYSSVGGKTSRKANTYAYLTDSAFDIRFNDNSIAADDTANLIQTYIANKLLSVASITETVDAKAGSLSIKLSAEALGASTTSTLCNVTTSLVTLSSDVDLPREGFSEGDKVLLTSSSASSYNRNNEVTINKFESPYSFSYIVVDTMAAVNDSNTWTISLVSEEIRALTNSKEATDFTTYMNREVFIYKALIATKKWTNPDDSSIV